MDIDALLGTLRRELWLVTAAVRQVPGGLVATFVMQISLPCEFPRMLIAIARHHHTWALIDESGAFALHLLSEQNLPLVWRFGLESGYSVDKFTGLGHRSEKTGSPILAGTIGWLDCEVEARLDVGDRTLFVGRVVAGAIDGQRDPLTADQLIALASASERQRLHDSFVRDCQTDADAITQWRNQRET